MYILGLELYKMRSTILIMLLTISITINAQRTYYGYGGSSRNQQITLIDNEGEAIAYIDFDEDATIFMWNGTPVAFLEKDRSDICVFGFHGGFMGWYENGIIYDKNGYPVGARKGAINMLTKMEGIKGMQKMVPMRPMTSMTPMKPFWKSSWSSTSLSEFLYFGRQ
jgi:hypothetical protein